MSRSQELFGRAQKTIPGGVNSPVRAFGPVGGTPPFIVRGEGCHVFDADGKRYVDYVGSWGPLILGHAAPPVIKAIQEAIPRGTSFGAPTEAEVELAELICERIPSAEMVRLVSSGTEATMTAMRLARGITGRNAILKFVKQVFEGHGVSWLSLVVSGSSACQRTRENGLPQSRQ